MQDLTTSNITAANARPVSQAGMAPVLLLVLLWSRSLFPQTYYLNIWSQGSVTSIPVQDIRKITFADVSDTFDNGSGQNVIQIFRLFQNYPNPFNPRTTLEYQIPAAGRVTIRIFDIKGQAVRTFDKIHTDAGTYKVTWDGTDDTGQTVASGFYLYQVTYASSVMTRKMLFLK